MLVLAVVGGSGWLVGGGQEKTPDNWRWVNNDRDCCWKAITSNARTDNFGSR